MSRVVRKETLYKHGLKIRFENSDFVSLDRNNLCRASTLNLDKNYSVETSIEL